MKKFYFAFASLMLTSLLMNGQITLSSTTSTPSDGDVYYYKRLDSTSAGLSYGTTGANVMWDYSALLDTFTTSGNKYATMYVTSSGTPYEGSFSGETVANTAGGYYDYYGATSTDYTYIGGMSSTSSKILSDSKTMLTFPFTYNSTFSDTYKGHTIGGSPIDTLYGTISGNGDAYGMLMLPGGLNYNNALRVKIIDTHIEEAFGYQFYYSYTTYNYYISSQRNPVFYVQYFVTYPVGYPLYGSKSKTAWMSFTPNAINELDNKIALNVFPNPTNSGLVNVSYNLDKNSTVAISVLNTLGQEVNTTFLGEQSQGAYNQTLQLNNLSKGIYTVKIQANNDVVCKKLVIQ